jgi:hypothetical protein
LLNALHQHGQRTVLKFRLFISLLHSILAAKKTAKQNGVPRSTTLRLTLKDKLTWRPDEISFNKQSVDQIISKSVGR